jgi:hypothetical protein
MIAELDNPALRDVGLSINDMERTEKPARGAAGKRLMDQKTHQQPEAEAP